MRYLFLLIITVSIFFVSCSEQTGKVSLTREDSLAISAAIKSEKDTSKPLIESTQKYVFESNFFAPILESTARTLHKAYLANPIPGIVDRNNNLIRGFYIEASDIANIRNRLVNGARIYFGRTTTGAYKLILVGVKTDMSNDLSYIADEFLPCPTSCPGDNNLTTLPPATRRAIYRTDLNWERTEGTTEIMKTFNNAEIVRQ